MSRILRFSEALVVGRCSVLGFLDLGCVIPRFLKRSGWMWEEEGRREEGLWVIAMILSGVWAVEHSR